MKKLTDKQLLQLTKTELLEEYRKLESMNNKEESSNMSLDEAIEVVEQNNMIVKRKTSYDFQRGGGTIMPYMYCNESGCNETVKLPANYCAKHQPAKLPESIKIEQPTDKIVVRAKKTAK